jgi:hypothetical protein
MIEVAEPVEQFCGRPGPCVVVTVEGQRRWQVTHDGQLCEQCNVAHAAWQAYFRKQRQADG